MVDWMREHHGYEVDVERSFYVGDAAGRQNGWKMGAKKDWNDTDRKVMLISSIPICYDD